MTALGQALSVALIHFVWQGLAIAGVLWIALLALRRPARRTRGISRAVRHWLRSRLRRRLRYGASMRGPWRSPRGSRARCRALQGE